MTEEMPGSLLSFPHVSSGNPVLFFCPFIRVAPDWGKSLGFPIKNVGNDRGGRWE